MNCPFVHDTERSINQAGNQSRKKDDRPSPTIHDTAAKVSGDASSSRAEDAPAQTISRRVERPVPKAQVDDPRTFQLNQVRRRFKPEESDRADATILDLKIAPSDPDFPFDMDALKCTLTVPKTYPAEKPTIRVKNNEMGRGYQLNVEAGFSSIIAARPNGTILQWLNALDQQLESLLTKEKAETVKIVVNQKKASEKAAVVVPMTDQPAVQPSVSLPMPRAVAPTYSPAQLQEARSRRDLETRQLEARLGRQPQFVKASDGITFTLPIEPRRRSDLPLTLQSVKTLRLIVPQTYPLQPCRIELQGVAGAEAEALQEAFKARCIQIPDLSLMSHVNYFSQNMHVMAATEVQTEKPPDDKGPQNQEPEVPPRPEGDASRETDDSRSHIITIPRPPEWDAKPQNHSSDSEDSYYSNSDDMDSNDEDVDEDEDETPAPSEQAEVSQAQRGILMSFPNLEMHGIELMEVFSVSVEIKCERCKTQTDVQNIKNNVKVESAAVRAESCRKCANSMSVGELSEYFSIAVVPADITVRRLPDGSDTCEFRQGGLSRS